MAAQPPAAAAAQLGSLWSILEDQRGEQGVPLLSSAWSLPGSQTSEWERHAAKQGLLRRAAVRCWAVLRVAAAEVWAFTRADPRRPVFAAKVGLALALISLLFFLRQPFDIASHSVWALLTVVVVFEFRIG